MKMIIITVLSVIFQLATYASFLWAIVEFILYLFKDHVFNLNSVYAFCISLFLYMALLSLGLYNIISKQTITPTTKWQKLLNKQK